jgi:L-fuconolactonase
VLVNRTQLDAVAQLADALPQLRINLNHLGYPLVSGASFDSAWQASIRSLATRPNVYAKLSGLPQAYGTKGWTAADFEPYIRTAVDAFGPERVNYAGNWFVLERYGNYSSMLRAVHHCLAKLLDEPAIGEVMHGTAARLYRIDEPRFTSAN